MPDDIGMNDFLNLLQQRRFQNITNGNLPQPMDERPPADLHIDHRHYTDSGPEPTNQVQQMNLAQEPEFPDAAQSVPQTPQFQAPQIGPEETKYREMQKQQPMLSNYHPSRLRSILASIAGGVAGINDPTGGARAQALNQAIRYGPYRQQLEQFNQGLGVQKSAAEQEIGDVSRAATQGHLAAQSEAEVARRQAEEARGRKYEYDISDTAFNRRMQELAVQHPGTNAFHEAKLKDGSLVYLKRDNQTGRLINTDTNLPVEMSAIDVLSDPNKSLKQTQDEKIPAALQASIKAREIVADPKQQGTPAYEAAQEFIKNLSQGKDPKTAFDAVKDKTNEERRAKGQPEMSSSELTRLAKQLQPAQGPFLIDPNTNTLFRGQPGQVLPPNVRTPQQEGQINTPTAATRGRGEAAQTAIAAGQDVQNFVTQNKAKFGNISNYWNNITSNTPAADPTVEKLRGKIMSWAAFQAAAHGFRASTVMREFESRVGPQKNADAIISAIQGINDELQHAVDTGRGNVSAPSSAPIEEYVRDPKTGKLVLK